MLALRLLRGELSELQADSDERWKASWPLTRSFRDNAGVVLQYDSSVSTDRRQQFKEFMSRFDPKVDPADTLAMGHYVEPPIGTAHRIANRFAIESASSHLLIGGVGTGKTTELHAIARALVKHGDTKAYFVDVPSEQNATKLRPGVLLALAWTRIGATLTREELPDDGKKTFDRANEAASGWWAEPWDLDGDDREQFIRVPGILTRPEADPKVKFVVEGLKMAVETSKPSFVMLFDGLDRFKRTDELLQMVLVDVLKLHALGIGCVVVGPPDIQLDVHQRQFAEHFSGFHFHGAADFVGTHGRAFLVDVLLARQKESLLQTDALQALAFFSGGILRDLVALARDAAEIAYARGADLIVGEHVEAAADRLGRLLLLGLSSQTLERVTSLRQHAKLSSPGVRAIDFTAGTPEDIDLLVRRLVVQVADIPPRYFLHPSIVPLITGLRAQR